MLTKEIENILKEIFSTSNSGVNTSELKAPSFEEAIEFAQLVIANSNEEQFQKFLERNPHFIIRSTQFGNDAVLGVVFKPPIGNFHNADFAIVRVGQGAPSITLIEIESPLDNLFTKKLTFAKKLQNAKGQVDDWKEWIKVNNDAFTNSTLELLCRTKLHSQSNHQRGLRFRDDNEIRNAWSAFGGNDYCFINYLIIIGRWSKLTSKEQKRLLLINGERELNGVQIRTFDQVIRSAFDGPRILG